MDPITAGLLALKAGFEMVTEIVKGQPPEVKAKIWERWLEQTEWFDELFKPKP
jgi:hypothetical protein